jgi:hypothetical protein
VVSVVVSAAALVAL